MNIAIQIRRALDGRIQARRLDGKRLTPADWQEARRLAVLEDQPIRSWVVEEIIEDGKLQAVLICSSLVEDHLWLILERTFQTKDGLAIYYPEELPILRTKTTEELRAVHEVKLAYPGCRVIEEGAESR